jgi:hypothetical protein
MDEVYMIYNHHTKSWYKKCESSAKHPQGYAWVKQEDGTLFLGNGSRDMAFRHKRSLLANQGYSSLEVKKFILKEVEDK